MSKRGILRGLLLPPLLMLGACDGSLVSGQPPRVSRVHAFERVADLPNTCGVAGAPLVRFSMLDQFDRSIGPGTEVATLTRRTSVIPGDTFDSSDVSVVDRRAVLYPTPAVLCASDEDCAGAGFDGATCRELLDGWSECGVDAVLSVDAGVPLTWTGPGIDADTVLQMDALVLVPHGALQVGVLPSGHVDSTFSTDPERDLSVAAAQLVRRLAYDYSPGPDRMAIGVYPGQDGAPLAVYAGGLSWFEAESPIALSEELSELYASVADPTALPADPVSALLAALSDSGWQADSGRRHVVLMVDAVGALTSEFDVDALGRALAEAGAVLHVVQLDNEVACPTSGRHAVGPCTPCEGEGCAPPLLLARSGVSAELAELACVSGGSYAYADAPEELVASTTRVANALSGSWVAGLSLAPEIALPEGAYAAQYELSVTLLDEVRTFRLDVELSGSVADARQLVWVGE